MNNKYKVAYSPEARTDIRSIYSYIRNVLKEPKTAKEQSIRIREQIKTLDTFPERNTPIDWEPWLSMGMRKMPVDNFVVFYLTDNETHTVTIVRIVYGRRNMSEIII